MAEAIAAGIKQSDQETEVKIYNAGRADKNDILTEVFKSKAIVVGSPTVNKGILYGIAGLLDMIKGLAFKKKMGASFGCYGWSGESVGIIKDILEKSGFEMVEDGLKLLWNPDEPGIEACIAMGTRIGDAFKQ
jgi:flavorubredoxin